MLLLLASYVFYGFWDYRFLALLAISTVVDFFVGKKIYDSNDVRTKKMLVTISVIVNLTILGFFKYFNFFRDSAEEIIAMFGFTPDFVTLNVILPVGISFYTFQTLSYSIDIYRNELKPCKSILDFGLFVSFFPQLVAGPIERASRFIPQLITERVVSLKKVNVGIFLIVWGIFKKIVIADNMALIADHIFNGYADITGIDLAIGVLAFAFQIYGDFSGYTDIARGVALLMGFDLMLNFRLPYFANSPSDFWKRWHISLSSWLRDYLYIPLGGNRNNKTNRNLMVTMVLGGLWHGAAWNFVLWGIYHGLILGAYKITKFDTYLSNNKNRFIEYAAIGFMFILTLFGWMLFRAHSFDQVSHFITNFSFSFSGSSVSYLSKIIFFISPLIFMQIWQQRKGNLLIVLQQSRIFIICFYLLLLLLMIFFGVRESTEFIYFQF